MLELEYRPRGFVPDRSHGAAQLFAIASFAFLIDRISTLE